MRIGTAVRAGWLSTIAALFVLGVSAPLRAETKDHARLRLLAERHGDAQSGTVVAYGNGVGIWNGRVQFRIDDEHLKLLLDALETAHFRDMPDSFGEADDQVRLARRISLKDGDYAKQVVQILDEDESEALKKLTDRVFEVLEPLTKDGRAAAGLADGLTKLASGELAPEALHLIVHYKPKAATAKQPGFLFMVEDGLATRQPFTDKGYGEKVEVPLDVARVREIVSTLSAADPGSLPANLYARDYSEVVVQVLNQRKSLLARQFAGMKPDALGEKQGRFDRLFERLRGLAESGPKASPGVR